MMNSSFESDVDEVVQLQKQIHIQRVHDLVSQFEIMQTKPRPAERKSQSLQKSKVFWLQSGRTVVKKDSHPASIMI